MINGKQCTIVWYVDDNKISHVDKNVVTDILEKLKGHFGNFPQPSKSKVQSQRIE